MTTLTVRDPGVVHPLNPSSLRSFLSKTSLDKKTITGIMKAMHKYNNAINKAGIQLEKDLNKCTTPPVHGKKPSPKGKSTPKKKT
jgi:hypothetical protein